jgi:hypothetical protein
MEKLTRLEVNCTTGEVQEIELTAEEIKQRETDAAIAKIEADERAQAEADKLAAKASAHAKLAKLGLLPDEIAALL